MCCRFGRFPRSAVGLSVLLGGGGVDEVMCPVPSAVNECILKEHGGMWRRARGERVSHDPPKGTGCVWLKKGCWRRGCIVEEGLYFDSGAVARL